MRCRDDDRQLQIYAAAVNLNTSRQIIAEIIAAKSSQSPRESRARRALILDCTAEKS
jgi:hypothetical protein